MEINILKSADSIIKCRHQWLDGAHDFKAKIAPFASAINALMRISGDNVSVSVWTENIEIRMAITDMKETIPYIESLQEIIGKEFDQTEDDTVYSKSRTFKMTGFPLTLIADVSDAPVTANCKAVQVGEKVVPVYELQCD